jgi:cation:H+ antiporter
MLILPMLAVLSGFALLLWSADRFVDGAAATARHLGVNPLVIGVMIVGFGTSAPEMVVSAMAALDGKPDLALGNAYGSNIINTGLILGLTALVAPIAVHSTIVRKELPLLLGVGAASGVLLWDGALTRPEGLMLLAAFFGLVGWSLLTARSGGADTLAGDVEQELAAHPMPLRAGIFWLAAGLLLLIVSSRLLVWGAIEIAASLGVSDLVVGLTVVALGTSLPELATSVIAARKGEHDIALGNVVGSNIFNLLAVVGIAVVIDPMRDVAPEVLTRDWSAMMGLTVVLLIVAYGFRGPGRINRYEGALLLAAYAAHTTYLVASD